MWAETELFAAAAHLSAWFPPEWRLHFGFKLLLLQLRLLRLLRHRGPLIRLRVHRGFSLCLWREEGEDSSSKDERRDLDTRILSW